MKKSVWFILLIGIGLVVALLLIFSQHKVPPKQTVMELVNQKTNVPPIKQILVNKPASQLTAKERATLQELFNERFKPAIDRWANAYKGRIPFDVSQINLKNFYAVSAGNYTFMIGSTTFVIYNGVNGAKVFYMMTKQGAKDLNSIPSDGKPRDLTVPVTREQVLKMAEADTETHYELKDVVIKPTATFCNIDGGANVEVGIKYENGGMLVRPNNLFFVLDSNGMLVTYQH